MPQLRRSAAAAVSIAAAISLTLVGSAAGARAPGPPNPPQQLQVVGATDSTIELSWAAPNGRTAAASYALTLDGAPAGTTTSLDHVFDGLVCATKYIVGVATVAADGSTSAVRDRQQRTDRCPNVTLTSTPPASTDSRAATFVFSSTVGSFFLCSLDGAAFAACSSPQAYSGLADGTHTFQVRLRRGGPNAVPVSYTWAIATAVLPTVALTVTPPALSGLPTAAFVFSSTATDVTYECALDLAAFSACTSPKPYVGLIDGKHTFKVRAVRGSTTGPVTTYAWTVDTGGGL